jgi:hypothetical protein
MIDIVGTIMALPLSRPLDVQLGRRGSRRAADHESEVPNINVYLIITLANSSLLIIIPFTLHSFGNPRLGK